MRECGECVACCVWPAVPEIEKPYKTPCENLSSAESRCKCTGKNNCGIYEDRPKRCAGYRCAWLMGFGETHDRPDRCGLLLDIGEDVKGAPTARPLWAGAELEYAALGAAQRMSEQMDKPVLLSRYSDDFITHCVGRGYRRVD